MSGILRFLPLTLTVSFLILGIMLNNMPWLIAGVAAVTLWAGIAGIGTAVTNLIPAWLGGGEPPHLFTTICSLIPGATYLKVPSVWFALMGYFMTYIICNANNIFTATPATASGYNPAGMGSHVLVASPVVASRNSIGVVQRRSVGMISLIAVSILFMIIMIPRFMNQCESTLGIVSGLLLGSLWGWGMWASANTNTNNPLADIHGVMLGLSPGYLRHTPIACTPSPSG